MRHGKQGSLANRWLALIGLGVLIGLIGLVPAAAQQIHRNGFEGRQTAWTRGEDNVRAEEKIHQLSSDYVHQGTNSEYIQIACPEVQNESNYIEYYYATQPAPIGDDLTASVWVKANRAACCPTSAGREAA